MLPYGTSASRVFVGNQDVQDEENDTDRPDVDLGIVIRLEFVARIIALFRCHELNRPHVQCLETSDG